MNVACFFSVFGEIQADGRPFAEYIDRIELGVEVGDHGCYKVGVVNVPVVR